MLSRVADRMYWLGRYTERAENSARMLSVNTLLALDLPQDVHPNWPALVRVTGSHTLFAERGGWPDEQHVVDFMLADADNPGSLISSLAYARENARVTRDVISSEAWEHVNDLFLLTQARLGRAMADSDRYALLQDIIAGCQKLSGIMSSTMSHDHAYNFTWLGRTLERADMTTRILDLGRADFMPAARGQSEEARPYEDLLWVSVLRSLGAYQTYRRNVQSRVIDVEVVQYLLQDRRFPRSVAHCLEKLEACLRDLPGSWPVRDALRPLQGRLALVEPAQLLAQGLHQYLDQLQQLFNGVHEAVVSTWLRPPGRRTAA